MLKKRKKILIDCSPLSKGGGVQVAISTLSACLLDDFSMDYKFIIPRSIYKYLPDHIKNKKNIYWVNKKTLFEKLKLILELYLICFEYKPDIVYTLFGPPYFKAFTVHLVGFAVPLLIYPTIKEYRNYKMFIKNFIDIIFFKFSDFYIVETSTVKMRLKKVLNCDSKNIFILENSVNPELKKINSTNKETNKNQILIPSSYYAHKNLEIIIPIVDYISKYKSDFKFILTIDNKEFKNKFFIKFKNDNLHKYIINIGPQTLTNLAKYYLNSEIIFLPTLLECSTAVYPESFYFRKPLITSNLDFARELCGQAAIFCNPRDYIDCANKIIKLLDDNKLQKELINHGDKQLKNYLKNEKRISKLQIIFDNILDS